jgi:hypothetical protein
MLEVEYERVKGVSVIANAIATSVDDPEGQTDEITFHVMSPEEVREDFERAAQLYFHMSGEAFMRAWDAGEFDEHPDHSNVVCVYMLSPLGR